MARAVIGPEPVRRLAIANSVAVVGDAMFTVSLAGSLFFNVSVDAARPTILLYLLLTLAPFAVVGPFVGSIIDRFPGSQRALIAATNVGRAVTMVLIARELRSLAFFPLAFIVLVLVKTSSVAKSSLVPWLVDDERRLVAENARLSRLTALAGGVGGILGAAGLALADTQVVLIVAAAVQLLATPLALRIPRVKVVASDPVVDDVELHSGAVSLAANAMSIMRGAVGFLAFLLAFDLKVAGTPAWFYGLVIAAAGVGGFAGTFIAAFARQRLHEETLLALSLGGAGVTALVIGVQYGKVGALVVALTTGIAANVARQAFDSLTQRLAPDAEKGRAFARFETRFQVAWVLGALVPVLLRPAGWVGLAGFGLVLTAAGVLYASGLRALRRHQLDVQASLDPEQDLPHSLLAMASGLHAQGADRLAVTTAVDAVRVAHARSGRDAQALPVELAALWQDAIAGTGPLEDGIAARALELARAAVVAD